MSPVPEQPDPFAVSRALLQHCRDIQGPVLLEIFNYTDTPLDLGPILMARMFATGAAAGIFYPDWSERLVTALRGNRGAGEDMLLTDAAAFFLALDELH